MTLRQSLLLLCLLFSLSASTQDKIYNGTFTVLGPEAGNAVIHVNQFKMMVSESGAVQITMHFRGSPRSEPTDYVDLQAEVDGQLENAELNTKGTVRVELGDDKEVKAEPKPVLFKAQFTETGCEGQVLLYGGKDQSNAEPFLHFKAVASGDEAPELTYPAGRSPKVFISGWVFGASFTLPDEKGNLIDLSDQVEWSGTADFSPAKGKRVHPVFNSVGDNEIILTVNYEGKKYEKKYPVTTVDLKDYAYIGCKAYCPADSHGGPADPLPVMGFITTGSSLITINGFPAARVGDGGVHASCCGSNTFEIISGDNEVLIEGKPAAKFLMSQTRHCGGKGNIIEGSKQFTRMLNKDVTVNGKAPDNNSNTSFSVDDEVETGKGGIFTFPVGSQTLATLSPGSLMKITGNTKDQLKILLQAGSLMVNGNTQTDQKLLVELKNLSVKPRGTHFIITTNESETWIRVIHGEVNVSDRTTGLNEDVKAGFAYHVYGEHTETLALEDSTGSAYNKTLLAHVDKAGLHNEFTDKPVAGTNTNATSSFDFVSFVRRQWIWLSLGLAALIIILFFLIRRKEKLPPPF